MSTMQTICRALLVSLLVLVLPAPLGHAQDAAPTACAACHPDEGASGHRAADSATDPKGCAVCHEIDATGKPAGKGWIVPEGEPAHVAVRDAACVTCHEQGPLAATHEPVAKKECTRCHDPHDRRSEGLHLTKRREAQICVECHEPAAGMFVHTVVKRGECTACHPSHGSDQPHLLRGPTVSSSCGDCHEEETGEHAFPHEPTRRGECESCHLPHASDHEGLLRDEGLSLCEAMCHKTNIRENRQIHSAIDIGGCAGCHDPHGSDNAALLRSDPLGEACLGCHKESLVSKAWVHKPVADGQCTICHAAHGSDYPNNLRAPVDVICTSCHTDKWRPDVGWPHPAVETEGCTRCHDPHSSDRQYFLRDSRVALCGSCHPNHEDGRHVEVTMEDEGHPVESLVDPDGGRSQACSVCHDPHGTDNPRMWYRAFSRRQLCLECHRETIAPGSTPGSTREEQQAEADRARYLERRSQEQEH